MTPDSTLEAVETNDNKIIYTDGEIELNVSVGDDTIWLTQNQIAELFEVTKQNTSLHINNILKEEELSKISTVKDYLTVQQEGRRTVTRNLEHYNLDMIISVGYRINSKKATKFRQWATKILKNYITNGYSINSDKITKERFDNLELDVIELKKKQFASDTLINNILTTIEQKEITPSKGIFYDGQIFDAHNFISELIRSAKNSIMLVDNYIDDTTLILFSKNQNIKVTLFTHTITKQLQNDLFKYNSQYNPIEIKTLKNSHDRFLIIDDVEIYHIGASLKDLGKKWFGFGKFESDSFGLIQKLKENK